MPDTKPEVAAVHQLNSERLSPLMQLGGIPRPSIALAPTENMYTWPGADVAFLFSDNFLRNTDAPVYLSDAWTPVFPEIVRPVNRDFERLIYDEVADSSLPRNFLREEGEIYDFLKKGVRSGVPVGDVNEILSYLGVPDQRRAGVLSQLLGDEDYVTRSGKAVPLTLENVSSIMDSQRRTGAVVANDLSTLKSFQERKPVSVDKALQQRSRLSTDFDNLQAQQLGHHSAVERFLIEDLGVNHVTPELVREVYRDLSRSIPGYTAGRNTSPDLESLANWYRKLPEFSGIEGLPNPGSAGFYGEYYSHFPERNSNEYWEAVREENLRHQTRMKDTFPRQTEELLNQAKDVQSPYFEAKPRGSVSFSDVSGVVVPEEKSSLGRSLNIPTFTYPPGETLSNAIGKASRSLGIVMSHPATGALQLLLDASNRAVGTKPSLLQESLTEQRRLYDQGAPMPATPELLEDIKRNPPFI